MALDSDRADDQLSAPTNAPHFMTADVFYSLPDDGLRHELVRGVVQTMPPAGGGHGRLTSRASFLIQRYIWDRQLGDTFAAETGFIVARDPDTVLAPDFAFIRAERAEGARAPRGFVPVPPDLVVEVVSPGDTATEVQDKTTAWLQAGVRLVWLVYPAQRQVMAYRTLNDVRVLTAADMLDGGDVLPGFTCPVADVVG
jgi:Uma2 family endonuclease